MNKKSNLGIAVDRKRVQKQIAISFAIVAVLLLVFVPLASTDPDGLERVAQDLGFSGSQPLWSGLFPDYASPVGGSWLGTFLAGVIGVVIVFACIFLIAKIVTLKRKSRLTMLTFDTGEKRE